MDSSREGRTVTERNDTMNTARVLRMTLLLGASLLLVGCGDAGNSTAGGTKISVYLLPKVKGVPYFETCDRGAEEAAKELGNVELTYDGPVDGSADSAAKLVERWALQGAGVIAVSANDPAVLAQAMK